MHVMGGSLGGVTLWFGAAKFDRRLVNHPVLSLARRALSQIVRELENDAAFAGPATLSRRVAVDDGVRGDVLGNYGAGADECMFANGIAADNRCIGTNACTTLDTCWQVVFAIIARKGGARRGDVRKHHRRTAKNIVFQRDALIHRDIVLNLHVVADLNAGANYDILTDPATFADS